MELSRYTYEYLPKEVKIALYKYAAFMEDLGKYLEVQDKFEIMACGDVFLFNMKMKPSDCLKERRRLLIALLKECINNLEVEIAVTELIKENNEE